MLISNITDTRNAIAALNLDKTIPIGTADAGSFFNTQVLQSVDFGMSNIHAWFANVSASEAAGWVTDFFQTENLDVAATLPNRPRMFIAETGWPTVSVPVFRAMDVRLIFHIRRLLRMLVMRATAFRLHRRRTSRCVRTLWDVDARLTLYPDLP